LVDPPKIMLVGEAVPVGAGPSALPWFEDSRSTERLAAAITCVFASAKFEPREIAEKFDVRNVLKESVPANNFDLFRPEHLAAAKEEAKNWRGRMVIVTNRVQQAVSAAYGLSENAIPFCDFSLCPKLRCQIGYIRHPAESVKLLFDPHQESIGGFLYAALSFWRWMRDARVLDSGGMRDR